MDIEIKAVQRKHEDRKVIEFWVPRVDGQYRRVEVTDRNTDLYRAFDKLLTSHHG